MLSGRVFGCEAFKGVVRLDVVVGDEEVAPGLAVVLLFVGRNVSAPRLDGGLLLDHLLVLQLAAPLGFTEVLRGLRLDDEVGLIGAILLERVPGRIMQ